MNKKTKLILDSICLIIMSPLLGIMAGGIAGAVLKAIILTVAALAGLLASLFFEVNFKSFDYERLDNILFTAVGILGAIGGWIWGFSVIRDKAASLKEESKET